MKPEGPIARRTDYTVTPCTHAEAAAAVVAWHYAKGSSNTAVAVHALRKLDGTLVGAALWLPPTRVAAESVSKGWRNVLALSRLVVAPTEPKNAASLLLGRSIRLLPKRWHTLLTYADSRQGHAGTIYKATNWIDLGAVPGSSAWVTLEGEQVARRATISRTTAEMLALGHVRLPPSTKRKFVFLRQGGLELAADVVLRALGRPTLLERIALDYASAKAAHAKEHASATAEHHRPLRQPAQALAGVVLAELRDAPAPLPLPPSGLPLALQHHSLASLHAGESPAAPGERQGDQAPAAAPPQSVRPTLQDPFRG